ncbi:DinB family protein [Deinococcus pimensis]|uniref:DinB family protein n=1 Tax=Deinococcus pimensis TaxID=309888 RepID=UPI0005EBEC8E|nr:DinB family protein [Deinococcus pimensis]
MQNLTVTTDHPHSPDVARALWVLREARRRTLRAVSGGFDPDWRPPEAANSAGTLLYHVAAIELDWLYSEVRGEDFPEEATRWFPHDVREEGGRLTPVTGETVDHALDRLRWVRGLLEDTFATMTDEDFRRPRELPQYRVTPEWVLAHLALHEAQHAGQILFLRTLAGTPPR